MLEQTIGLLDETIYFVRELLAIQHLFDLDCNAMWLHQEKVMNCTPTIPLQFHTHSCVFDFWQSRIGKARGSLRIIMTSQINLN